MSGWLESGQKKVSVSVWDFTVWISFSICYALFPFQHKRAFESNAMQVSFGFCPSSLSLSFLLSSVRSFPVSFHSWRLSLLSLSLQSLIAQKEKNWPFPPLVFSPPLQTSLASAPISPTTMFAFQRPTPLLTWFFNACLLSQVLLFLSNLLCVYVLYREKLKLFLSSHKLKMKRYMSISLTLSFSLSSYTHFCVCMMCRCSHCFGDKAKFPQGI